MKLSLPSLKSDLRDDECELGKLKGMNKSPVTAATAEKYAKDNGFKAYMECSAKNQKVKYQYQYLMNDYFFLLQGLKDVFDKAIKIVLNKDNKQGRESFCQLL